MSDQVLIVLLNAPAYAIIGWLFWQFLKMQREENARRAADNVLRSQDEKRRDDRDDKLIDVVITGHQRLDAMAEDNQRAADDRSKREAAWIQAINNSTQMMGALDQRSAYLLQSDKEVSELQVAIRAEVKTMFDRFTRVFPTDKSIDMLFVEFQAAAKDEFAKACEKRKEDSRPIPAVTLPTQIEVTMVSPTDPTAAHEGGELPKSA